MDELQYILEHVDAKEWDGKCVFEVFLEYGFNIATAKMIAEKQGVKLTVDDDQNYKVA